MNREKTTKVMTCAHCGDDCANEDIIRNDLHFCCVGCDMVYTLLKENGLGAYYTYEEQPGNSLLKQSKESFEYLDDPEIIQNLLSFNEAGTAHVSFDVPQIHCSSCLFLLENLNKLDPGVNFARVNFLHKKVTIQFDTDRTSLRKIVRLLHKIGYAPRLNLDVLEKAHDDEDNRKRLLYQLGLAGFVFGNIMLLSFPEYLGFHQASVKMYIGYINIVLATPVLIYSGRDYIRSAWTSLLNKHANIDVPVALGMITLYLRSIYEIISMTGEGYLDSFAGFVFFLLIGRWFQEVTYRAIDFDRNYKSYFPISALVKSAEQWISTALKNVRKGDVVLIRNHEIIPVDGVLLHGKARIDYSFVTGESDLIQKAKDDPIRSGGRQVGSNIELEVTKTPDQSYLTQLWDHAAFKKEKLSATKRLTDSISRYFTIVILFIALITFTYWIYVDSSIAFTTFTSVLIVACPCALALAIPFTYGNITRILARLKVYLRNTQVIDAIQDIDHIVFDKTGTITDNTRLSVKFDGKNLTGHQESLIKSACIHSSHPLSRAIVTYLDEKTPILEVDRYEDVIGQGLKAEINGDQVKVGSSRFIFNTDKTIKETSVFIEVNGEYLGYFLFEHAYRDGIKSNILGLSKIFDISLLSGDSDKESSRMERIFKYREHLHFNQSPEDKLNYIKQLQDKGKRVMMVGDGLNDAGALKQCDVGVVIADNTNNFSPACDMIISADAFRHFLEIITMLRKAKGVIYGALILAFLYNFIGLLFAVSGHLSPVIAAILMPLSSITIIVYGLLLSGLLKSIYVKN